MKTCPSCHKSYEDDSLVFCLHDGATLLNPTMLPSDPNATLRLPMPNATQPGPTVASPQPTAPYQPEPPMQWTPPVLAQPTLKAAEPSRRSALPWILGIVVVTGIFGVIIALILTRDRGAADPPIARAPTPLASPAPSSQITPEPTPTVKQSEQATPTPAAKVPEQRPKKTDDRPLPGSVTVTRAPPERIETRPKPMFKVLNNISFNGSRITYYPRPSFGMCQADCAGNASCRGFTWIRPGAYNPGDSAMCYLLSAVTQKISHPCCISAVKN
jgi:hypothetical protein